MTRKELAAAKARCKAATGGPWGYDLNHTVAVVDGDEWGETIIQIPRGLLTPCYQDGVNLEFIANSRVDLPAALDMLDRAMVMLHSYNRFAPSGNAEALLREWDER